MPRDDRIARSCLDGDGTLGYGTRHGRTTSSFGGRRVTAVRLVALGCSIALACAAASLAASEAPPTIRGDVVIVDGDTLEVAGRRIDLFGIDAPEIFRPRCDAEKAPGRAAKAAVAAQVGETVYLRDIRNGKYAGRVVADAILTDGESLSARLLAQGHAIPDGAEKPWCKPKPDAAPPAWASLLPFSHD